ncbi:MAG: DUF4410 domain-containing protein [Acidobacteriota bacterium]
MFIQNFVLDASILKQESDVVPNTGDKDQVARAHHLTDLLAEAIVADLKKKGYPARRLAQGESLPADGLLVGGEFLQATEGKRMRRTVVGLGAGKVKLAVQVNVYDLAKDRNRPFLAFGSNDQSRKVPGSILLRNPWVTAARYGLSKGATDREVRRLGEEIAKDLVRLLEPSNGKGQGEEKATAEAHEAVVEQPAAR